MQICIEMITIQQNENDGLMVKHDLVKLVMDVTKISLRNFSVGLVLNEKAMTVIPIYGPKSSKKQRR